MSNISKSTTQKAKRLYSMFGQSMRKSLDIVIELGGVLVGVKGSLNHGEFGKYVKNNMEFDHDSACNYMNVYMANEQGLIPKECTPSQAYKLIRDAKPKPSNSNDLEKDKQNQIPNSSEFEQEDSDYQDLKEGEDYEVEDDGNEEVIDNETGEFVSVDRFKQDIPIQIDYHFKEAQSRYKHHIATIKTLQVGMKEDAGSEGFELLDEKQIEPRLKDIKSLLKFARPHCICPACSGDGGCGSKCGHCKGKGWMVEGEFRMLPSEYKEGLTK